MGGWRVNMTYLVELNAQEDVLDNVAVLDRASPNEEILGWLAC